MSLCISYENLNNLNKRIDIQFNFFHFEIFTSQQKSILKDWAKYFGWKGTGVAVIPERVIFMENLGKGFKRSVTETVFSVR